MTGNINISNTEDAFKKYNEMTSLPSSETGKVRGHVVFQIVKGKDGHYLDVKEVSSFELCILKILNFLHLGSETRLDEVFAFIRTHKKQLDRFGSYEIITKKLNEKAEIHNKTNTFGKINLFNKEELSFGKLDDFDQSSPVPQLPPQSQPTYQRTPIPRSEPTSQPTQGPNPNINVQPDSQPQPTSQGIPTPQPQPTQPQANFQSTSGLNPNINVHTTSNHPSAPVTYGLTVNGIQNPNNGPISKTPKLVGALADKWTFESDHVPVGGKIKIGNMESNFAVFNACNTAFLGFITGKNDQGLNGSNITKLDESKTRDATIRQHILNMISPVNAGGGGNDFLVLTECGPLMLNGLSEDLLIRGFRIKVVKDGPDTQAYIYNHKKFDLENFSQTPFTKNDYNKVISEVTLSTKADNGPVQKLRVVGTHLPGGPNSVNARADLGQYLVKNRSDIPTLVMGDMNATTDEVNQSIQVAFQGRQSPFVPISQGTRSHIDTAQRAIDFDSVFVDPGNQNVEVRERAPNEILPNLPQEILGFLA